MQLFHPTADVDESALAKLASDASASGISVHVLIDSRDGLLDGERIPGWRDASFLYCGPNGLATALRRDLAAAGLPVNTRFHQELFALR